MKYLVNLEWHGLRAGSVRYLRNTHTIERFRRGRSCFNEAEVRLNVDPPRCEAATEGNGQAYEFQ
jgi:hypothetical protein